VGTVEAAPRPVLLFVDDDEDLRETIRETATCLGFERCVVASSIAEIVQQRADALCCSVAILDINLGWNVPSGVDVYHWLQNAHFAGRIVFLTGHGADDPRVQDAARLGDVKILTKPIGIAEIGALASDVVAK
jgi:ActR/RegA family two-component response regulator